MSYGNSPARHGFCPRRQAEAEIIAAEGKPSMLAWQ